MFIQCPKCKSTFVIDEKPVLNTEQTFCCSSCQHTWTQWVKEQSILIQNDTPALMIETEVDQQAKALPVPEEKPIIVEPHAIADDPIILPDEFKPVPVTVLPKKHHWIKWIFGIIIFVLIAGGIYIAYTQAPAFYRAAPISEETEAAIPDTLAVPANIEIIDTSFRVVPNHQGGVKLVVQGALFNPNTTTQHTQPFYINLYDDAEQLVQSETVMPTRAQLEGKSLLPFYKEIVPISDTIKRMDIVFE